MHSPVFFILVILGLFLAVNADICDTTCTNGVEDDVFIASSTYQNWGMAYVRDSSLPNLTQVHSADITTGVIAIHGNSRDAYNYFCYSTFAASLAGTTNSSYIVAPHFYVASDTVPISNAFFWVSNSSWKEGGRSDQKTSRISSFDILDDMVAAFFDKTKFPGVTEVLVVGHSAGGQTVQRYAYASGIDKLYNVRYVIENPGSYAYLDTTRAVLPNLTLPTCSACNQNDIMTAKYEFALASRAQEQSCPTYNDWKMGYPTANVYLKKRTLATVRAEYKTKNVWYLLGTNDTCNEEMGDCGCSDNSLDAGCAALMQGFCRFQRGVIFYQYLQHYYNASTHNMSYVEGLAHDGCRMITSSESLTAMFPNAKISNSTEGTTSSGSTTSPDSTTTTSLDSSTSASTSSSTTTSFSGSDNDQSSNADKVVLSTLTFMGALLYILL